MSLIWWKAERLISDLPCSTGGSAILEDLQSGLSHRLDSGDILLVPSGVAHSLHAGSGAPLGPASSRPGLKMTFSENAGSGGRALLNRLSAALFALTLRLASNTRRCSGRSAGARRSSSPFPSLGSHVRESGSFLDPPGTLPPLQYVAGDVRTLFPEKSWPFSCGLSDFLLDIRKIFLAGNELDRPLILLLPSPRRSVINPKLHSNASSSRIWALRQRNGAERQLPSGRAAPPAHETRHHGHVKRSRSTRSPVREYRPRSPSRRHCIKEGVRAL